MSVSCLSVSSSEGAPCVTAATGGWATRRSPSVSRGALSLLSRPRCIAQGGRGYSLIGGERWRAAAGSLSANGGEGTTAAGTQFSFVAGMSHAQNTSWSNVTTNGSVSWGRASTRV